MLRHRYKAMMREESQELLRLRRRIADIRRCIDDAKKCDSPSWAGSEQPKMIALLEATLKALEARKIELENDGR